MLKGVFLLLIVAAFCYPKFGTAGVTYKDEDTTGILIRSVSWEGRDRQIINNQVILDRPRQVELDVVASGRDQFNAGGRLYLQIGANLQELTPTLLIENKLLIYIQTIPQVVRVINVLKESIISSDTLLFTDSISEPHKIVIETEIHMLTASDEISFYATNKRESFDKTYVIEANFTRSGTVYILGCGTTVADSPPKNITIFEGFNSLLVFLIDDPGNSISETWSGHNQSEFDFVYQTIEFDYTLSTSELFVINTITESTEYKLLSTFLVIPIIILRRKGRP